MRSLYDHTDVQTCIYSYVRSLYDHINMQYSYVRSFYHHANINFSYVRSSYDHTDVHVISTATGVINCLGYSKWLRLQVMLYIRSSAAYVVIMFTIGSDIQSSAKCWEQLVSGRMNTIIMLWLSLKKKLVVWSDTCLV